jgi:hypothetical protein
VKSNRWAAGGILLLSAGSYALSFEQLFHAAKNAHILYTLCIVYGLLLEGFVSLATYTAWVLRGTTAARYPWIVAIFAFSFSLYANATGGDVPPWMVRALPVVMVPVGVHLLIKLVSHVAVEVAPQIVEIEKRVEVPVTVEVEKVVEKVIEVPIEVPAAVTIDTIDLEKVENPKALASMLLAFTAETPSSKGYHARNFQKLTGRPLTIDRQVSLGMA